MRKPTIETIPVNRELHQFPRVIIFEIVAGCNLACIMCPYKSMTRSEGLMDFGLFKRLVDEIAATSPDSEIWAPIMGEVFLYGERVLDYIEYARRERNLEKVYLNSNLVVFSESMIPRLASSGLRKLTVGIDAATRETYDRIRVGGDFDSVEANVHAILGAKHAGLLPELELVLQFIVQDENHHEEELFKQKWIGSGATIKIRQRLGWGMGIPADNLDLPCDQRTIPCPWVMRTMSIHWTGEVAQCDAEWNGDAYVGDLRRQTIHQVWHDQLLGIRQRHLRNDFDMSPCRDCKDWQCGLSEVYR